MFTGLIEEIGTVKRLKHTSSGGEIVISTESFHEKARIKDSVAINGVCLTVVGRSGRDCTFVVSPRTLETTNLGGLKAGGKVNLEPALLPNTRLGGHYVLGHIDALGIITNIKKTGNSTGMEVSVPEAFQTYLAPKGSIALNGASLTVASIQKNKFTVIILPLTFHSTTLQYVKLGDRVNLEGDIIAKYIFRYLDAIQGLRNERGVLDEAFLKKYGHL